MKLESLPLSFAQLPSSPDAGFVQCYSISDSQMLSCISYMNDFMNYRLLGAIPRVSDSVGLTTAVVLRSRALALSENSPEMKILRPHFRALKSETLEWSQASNLF